MIVLALTAALVAPYFVDWTPYRADFEREASRILGRQVSVGGTASARLLPFPSVTFTDVVVAGVEPGEPAMTVETFSMDAELAPFLRGDVYIFDMRLVRPSMTVDLAEDGALDWAVRPSVPIGADHIALEKVTVTEGRVSLRHAVSGRTHMLTEINADMSARALTGPWRVEGSLRLDGMRMAVSVSTGTRDEAGGIRLRLRAQPERYPLVLETDGNARIEDGSAVYAGLFRLNASTTGERLRAGDGETFALASDEGRPDPPAYRLSGSFRFDHAALEIEEFHYEAGPPEDPYAADGSASFTLGAEPRFLIRADGAQVRFDDAGGDAAGGIGLDQRLVAMREFLLDMPRPAIPGRIEVRLPAIVAGDTMIRDVHLLAEPSQAGWTVASMGATLPGRATLEAAGELEVGNELAFDGSLLLAVGQPSGFAAWLARDVDDAIRRLPAAGFSAKVALSQERQSFHDLELMLGSATLRGEIDSRTPEGARPSMALRFDGDRLDVEGMAAFASLFISDSGRTRMSERDLSLEIAAGPVSAAGLTADKLDAALRLKDGRLEIDMLSIGGLAGANVSATGSIKDMDANPAGTIDATVIAADLAPLAGLLAARFPQSRLATGAAARAAAYPGLLEDAAIHLVASAAGDGEGENGLALSATGAAGGTAFSLTASMPAIGADPAQAQLALDIDARNDEAAALYALFGLPGLPLGLAGPAEAELVVEGAIARGAHTRLSFSGEGLQLGYEGEAAVNGQGLSASGEASLEAGDLEPWLMAAGMSLPGMGFGLPVRLEAQIDVENGLAMLSGLRGEVAGSAIDGDINASLRDGLPHLTGALALQAFDLALVAELATGMAALTSDGEGWPSAPFAQAVSSPVTADLELNVEQLDIGASARADKARMMLRLDREGVSVSDLVARAFGGTISGIVDFRNDSGTGLLSAQMRLDDAGIETLLGNTGISGRADLTAAVTASGKSVEGLVSALAGSGTASVRELAIGGLDPHALPALLALADTFGPDIDAAATAAFAPPVLRRGVFEAGSADIAFTIVDARFRAPPLRLVRPEATLSADLRADLGEGVAGVEATLAYAPGDDALVGSEPAARFSVEGPLDALDIHVDTEPLAQFLTQRALEREQQRVEAMQASLLERQRHRREIRYYAALADERQRAADEAERLNRELERLRQEAEKLRLIKEEAARQAKEAEVEAAEETAARPAAPPATPSATSPGDAGNIFTEESLSIDGLLRSIGEMP